MSNENASDTRHSSPSPGSAPICHCGTASHAPHETGKNGCERYEAEAPQPFGIVPETGADMWLVDGHLITDYTLRFQRGYAQHECGRWTRWAGSVNSLPDET